MLAQAAQNQGQDITGFTFFESPGFNLGQGIDIQNIAANYDNGVLTVTIPVSAQAKLLRAIQDADRLPEHPADDVAQRLLHDFVVRDQAFGRIVAHRLSGGSEAALPVKPVALRRRSQLT